MEHRSPSGANASDRQQIFDRDGHTEQGSVLMVPSGNSLASTVEAQCRQGVDNGIDFRNARFQYIEQFSAADRLFFSCARISRALDLIRSSLMSYVTSISREPKDP
ncbi:MAG: hypothetical protein Ct9H300mP14_04370 [Gammaproteobacteria bacterium]|nr:MAG: hypothetical protein Ct9H300mP14_04370 [Gammaproteobacteria bacterium]